MRIFNVEKKYFYSSNKKLIILSISLFFSLFFSNTYSGVKDDLLDKMSKALDRYYSEKNQPESEKIKGVVREAIKDGHGAKQEIHKSDFEGGAKIYWKVSDETVEEGLINFVKNISFKEESNILYGGLSFTLTGGGEESKALSMEMTPSMRDKITQKFYVFTTGFGKLFAKFEKPFKEEYLRDATEARLNIFKYNIGCRGLKDRGKLFVEKSKEMIGSDLYEEYSTLLSESYKNGGGVPKDQEDKVLEKINDYMESNSERRIINPENLKFPLPIGSCLLEKKYKTLAILGILLFRSNEANANFSCGEMQAKTSFDKALAQKSDKELLLLYKALQEDDSWQTMATLHDQFDVGNYLTTAARNSFSNEIILPGEFDLGQSKQASESTLGRVDTSHFNLPGNIQPSSFATNGGTGQFSAGKVTFGGAKKFGSTVMFGGTSSSFDTSQGNASQYTSAQTSVAFTMNAPPHAMMEAKQKEADSVKQDLHRLNSVRKGFFDDHKIISMAQEKLPPCLNEIKTIIGEPISQELWFQELIKQNPYKDLYEK